MKKRFLLLLKVLAWVPLLILILIFFLPIWLVTGKSTLNWFEKFDDSCYTKHDDLYFEIPPPPPTGGSGDADKYSETSVDKPFRY